MMRLPARLAAKIAKAGIARVFRRSRRERLFEYVDAAEVLHSGSEHPVSHERIRGILAGPASILWIGGGEPLEHPGIAHFVRALASSGKYVFLETDGALLRRRIHEFQPLPRLFFNVRLTPEQEAESELAAEGLRAARLSGFFTTVHSLIRESSSQAEPVQLCALVHELDVDAWLISSESSDPAAIRKAADARKMFLGAGWRWFSAIVERELLGQSRSREQRNIGLAERPESTPRQESVKVA